MVEVGKLYTISTDARTGDRSYVDSLWRVLAINHNHLVVTSLKGEYLPDGYWHGTPHIIESQWREMHEAKADMIDIMTAHYRQKAKEWQEKEGRNG